jgi:hypothetical protein
MKHAPSGRAEAFNPLHSSNEYPRRENLERAAKKDRSPKDSKKTG